jgi:hypothetical protein
VTGAVVVAGEKKAPPPFFISRPTSSPAMATEPPPAEKKKAPLPKVVTLNKALKLVSSPPMHILNSFLPFLLQCSMR